MEVHHLWLDSLTTPAWLSTACVNISRDIVNGRVKQMQSQASCLVHVYSTKHREMPIDLQGGGVFLSLSEEDSIKETDLAPIWPQVEIADAAEVSQFAQEKAFRRVKLSELCPDVTVVDGAWVRRWKMKNGQRVVKSRMCARGRFDSQKEHLATRSTTATRLSQRLLVSTAALMNDHPESWDVSGAFLKGLSFDKIRELLRKQGIKSPERSVVVIPPTCGVISER